MVKVDPSLIERLENSLRDGDLVSVRDCLRLLNKSKVPDRFALKLARIARRTDCANIGIALLRNRVIGIRNAQPAEVAEYAGCLLKAGVVAEATKILTAVDSEYSPDALKYLAFAFIHQWDYESALPVLRKYLKRSDITPYEKIIGRINFAAALIETEAFTEADEVLAALIKDAEAGGHRLILGNSYELRTHLYIRMGALTEVEGSMRAAENLLANAHSRYRLYLDKWKAIVAALKEGSTHELRDVRQRALAHQEWETVRDCDFYEAFILQDQKLFEFVYFGTAYPAYQRKIAGRCAGWAKIPSQFNWGTPTASQYLKLDSGVDHTGRIIFKKNQTLHRLFKALAQDFFKPVSLAELFSHSFHDEHFHPQSSPHRIHELVRRLRARLSETGLDLTVSFEHGGYRLLPLKGDCSIQIQGDLPRRLTLSDEILNAAGLEEFSLRGLAERINVPHTTVYREIKNMVGEGLLLVSGIGKKTRYRRVLTKKAS